LEKLSQFVFKEGDRGEVRGERGMSGGKLIVTRGREKHIARKCGENN